jgi:hypothetical protein
MNPETQQLLAIYLPLLSPIATLAIVVVGFIYNNSRMNDFRDRLGDTRELLRAEFKAELGDLRAEMRLEFEKVNDKIDALLKTMADIDARVTRLEARP